MAKATAHYGEPTPAVSVTLELTLEEADVLCVILGRVGGITTGPRKYAKSVFEALESVGFTTNFRKPRYSVSGEIAINPKPVDF